MGSPSVWDRKIKHRWKKQNPHLTHIFLSPCLTHAGAILEATSLDAGWGWAAVWRLSGPLLTSEQIVLVSISLESWTLTWLFWIREISFAYPFLQNAFVLNLSDNSFVFKSTLICPHCFIIISSQE